MTREAHVGPGTQQRPCGAGCEDGIEQPPDKWQEMWLLPVDITRAKSWEAFGIIRSFCCIVHFVSGTEGVLSVPFPFKTVDWNIFVKQNCDKWFRRADGYHPFSAAGDTPELYMPLEGNQSLFMDLLLAFYFFRMFWDM